MTNLLLNEVIPLRNLLQANFMYQRKIGNVREASIHWQHKAFVKGI